MSNRATAARQRKRWGALFLAPWAIGFAVLFVIPLALSLLMSFTNFELVQSDAQSLEWIGLENWRRLAMDPEVVNGFWVTIRFASLFVPLALTVPLGLAYLLTSERLWGRGLFRVIIYLPSVVPLVAMMIVWRFYLNDVSGWLPRLIRQVGIDPPLFLGDANWVIPTLAAIAMWGVGNSVIIFIAALNGVPKELYEAAKIDGAGKWALFRDVTWPMISPITFFNVVITLVTLGQYFLVPFILQGPEGRPEGASQFFTMVFFQETFSFFQAGYGAALAWAMFLVIGALTMALFWSARFWVHAEFEER